MVITHNIEALVFDLGGIVMAIDFDRAFRIWSRHSGVAAPLLKSRFVSDPAYERHERGEITADAYFESLRASLGLTLSDRQFTEGWNAILGHEMPGIGDLLRRANERLPLYLFSNTNRIHQACWTGKLSATLSMFRKCFVSCEMGLRKPEPQAFRAVAAAIGLTPQRILFFDDLAENVEGARRTGMRAVHVQSIADIESALAALPYLRRQQTQVTSTADSL